MKCDELESFIAETFGDGKCEVYEAVEVDAAIAELKRKLQDQCISCPVKMQEDDVVAELKQKLESVQASMYCDVVDAGMDNRRLKRALWLARAESAKNAECRYHCLAQKEVCDPQPHGWSCYINGEVYPTGKMSRKLEPHYWFDIWDEVESKCRAKAEEYK